MPFGAVIEDQMALDNIPRFACLFSSEISCESHTAISSMVEVHLKTDVYDGV
jgi:hypothetical protein